MKAIFILLVLCTALFAQEYSEREREFFDLQNRYYNKLDNIDSLKNNLNQHMKIVEQVKENEPGNRDKIAALLADGLNQSNIIDNKEQELRSLRRQLTQQRNFLYNFYSHQIDSLEHLSARSDDNLANEKRELELRDLNSKRLQVSPILSQLEFDPQVIEKINMSKPRDEKERRIYKEYLDNALNEVDSSIIQLQTKSNEIRETVKLNELAEDFLEDVESSQFTGSFVVAERTVAIEDAAYGYNRGFDGLTEKVTVAKIYNRISPFVYENIGTQEVTVQDSLFTDDYLQLLEETEKSLKLYREKIMDKLKQ